MGVLLGFAWWAFIRAHFGWIQKLCSVGTFCNFYLYLVIQGSCTSLKSVEYVNYPCKLLTI